MNDEIPTGDDGNPVYYVIERSYAADLHIAEMVKIDDDGNLEYITPDGRHGGIHHGKWVQYQQKNLDQIRAMEMEGVLTVDTEQFINEVLSRE